MNGRGGGRRKKAGDPARDRGNFVALPHVVLDSPGWRQASHTARSLLVDIARQYKGDNNGKLVATPSALQQYGWKSPTVLTHARRELIACGLLVEVRAGGKNRASWFALTWYDLHQTTQIDIDPRKWESVHRRGYMRPEAFARPRRRLSSASTPEVAAPPRTDTRRVTKPPQKATCGVSVGPNLVLP